MNNKNAQGFATEDGRVGQFARQISGGAYIRRLVRYAQFGDNPYNDKEN
jgi:hypothetical protein